VRPSGSQRVALIVARDFVFGSGTAESPPAVVLVLLVLAALLAAVRGRVSVIGCVAVAALSDWIAAVNAFRLAMETERTQPSPQQTA
jgi:hypothetical protein